MSAYKNRLSAIQAIIAGTVLSQNPIVLSSIADEFTEVVKLEKLQPLPRRRLLQVLHSTRALDSFLKGFTASYGIRGRNNSLGGYLRCLAGHSNRHIGQLPSGSVQLYQQNIVNRRNTYMHEAGAFPSNEKEILSLLAEMHACISAVASL